MSNFGLAMDVDIGGHKLGVFKKETTLIDHNDVHDTHDFKNHSER